MTLRFVLAASIALTSGFVARFVVFGQLAVVACVSQNVLQVNPVKSVKKQTVRMVIR